MSIFTGESASVIDAVQHTVRLAIENNTLASHQLQTEFADLIAIKRNPSTYPKPDLYPALLAIASNLGETPARELERSDQLDNHGGCAALTLSLLLDAESVPANWMGKSVSATYFIETLATEADRLGYVVRQASSVSEAFESLRSPSTLGVALPMITEHDAGHVIGVIASDNLNGDGEPQHYWVVDGEAASSDLSHIDMEGLPNPISYRHAPYPAGITTVFATNEDTLSSIRAYDHIVSPLIVETPELDPEPLDFFFAALARN
ncbi:MAG: hypothetical protein UX62_C0044G0014 [Microgenomates group bacterium GW2011_GWA2_46_7]|nr:MAG: hypothetical protein UX62_C0044G0014 [Microgenomates group bacterium GW2011_GWA2_46_7]